MATNSSALALSLNYASAQLNRYYSLFIFIFGVLGNILNCLVLSRRTLRRNPCAFLFLISSVASLVSILAGLTTRMLAGWAADLTSTINWLCQLRAFVLFVSRTMALWFLALASIDRWLSSSIDQERRRKSSLKNTYKSVMVITFVSMVLYTQILVCYQANMVNTPLKCYGKTESCRVVTDLSYALISIILPIVVMITFGLKTVSNVRHSYHRIGVKTACQPIRSSQNQATRWKKTDYHLLLMLLVQTVLLCFFTLPQAIQKIYSTFTERHIKSSVQTAVENLIFNLLLLSTYFSSGIPFYIYTLFGGTLFRQALIDMMPKFPRRK